MRQAAEQGCAKAQCYLGGCYDQGDGVPLDHTEAVKWYRKAAEQGHMDGQCYLGISYATGDGVSQDVVEAYQWVKLAEEQGCERASKVVASVEALLSPEQLVEAERHYRGIRSSRHFD